MFPIIKIFYYQITDPFYSESIEIDISEYPTVLDLKKMIASIWNYSDYNVIFNNPPEESQLIKIEEHYIFDVTIRNRCKDLSFYFPDEQIILIKNGYKKRYDEIMRIFKKNNLYYSKKCVKNIHFFNSGNELIPNIEFPFLAIPNDSYIEVKLSCDAIVLKYGEDKFILCENESAIKAYKLIQKVFKGYHSISIFNNDKNEKLNYTDELIRYEEYSIQVIFTFTFKNIERNSSFIQNLDFFSTVFDAQNSLAKIYKKNPEDIILYDENKEKIYNSSELLINIHFLDKAFEFEVKNDFISFLKNDDLKMKNYPKTPEKKFNPSIDLDIILKKPIYSKTPEQKFKQKNYQEIQNFDTFSQNQKITENVEIEKDSDSEKVSDEKFPFLIKLDDFDIIKNQHQTNQIEYNIKSIYDDDFDENKKVSFDSKNKTKNENHQLQKIKKQKEDKMSKNVDVNKKKINCDNDNNSDKFSKSKKGSLINNITESNSNKLLKTKSKSNQKINDKEKPKKSSNKSKKENELEKQSKKLDNEKNVSNQKQKQKPKQIKEEKTDDVKTHPLKSKSKKIVNIYDDFYKKEEEKLNSSQTKIDNEANKTKKTTKNHSSLLENSIIIEEEEEERDDENNVKINICKSFGCDDDDDSQSEIEMNSSEKDNISDIKSNHLTLSPNCNSLHLSDLQSEINEEEEEEID